MAEENYCSRKPQLVREFNDSIRRVRHLMISRFGEAQAENLIEEAFRQYESLIPQIPYIGTRNRRLLFLLPTTRFLAIYRALQRHGKTIEDAGQLIYDISEAELNAMPRMTRKLIGYFWFSPLFLWLLKKRGKESHDRKYPGDFVFNFVEGAGNDFDYGIDYLECANLKFLESQDALELMPFICAVDKMASEKLGWGLTRTMTLADGCSKCDFRFKKCGGTSVPVPSSWTQLSD